ncbi:hypothetical protein NP233_g4695 [Leucocoprinus birnbaumii]|uniref:Uncharacterized protein n=1 Tax=Leucocoprinus birnbaumii TaxID=56174 RepID=A0AAD5VU98_9AGAR|nr:hypothetical protein NP233_g4695 [Leucocoprinus birnbaumii]
METLEAWFNLSPLTQESQLRIFNLKPRAPYVDHWLPHSPLEVPSSVHRLLPGSGMPARNRELSIFSPSDLVSLDPNVMHPQFLQLFPYAFAGISLGTFLPFGNNVRPERARHSLTFPTAGDDAGVLPPGVDRDTTHHSGLHELLIRCIASIWDVIGTIFDLPTILQREESRFPRTPADSADPHTRFMSAARALGWTGLAGVSADGLISLGALRGPDGGSTTQDEQSYIRRYISYTLADVFTRRDDAVMSPGVLNDIARTYVRTGRLPSIPSVPGALDLDDEDIDFIIRSVAEIASLVTALIPLVENEPDIRGAFRWFAEDPTSPARYSSPPISADALSAEQIVRQTRLSQARGSSFRTLTVGFPAGKPARFPSTVLGAFNGGYPSGFGGTPTFNAQTGAVPVTLRDEEVEYLAALFIAALMQFHAGGPTSALSFRRAV